MEDDDFDRYFKRIGKLAALWLAFVVFVVLAVLGLAAYVVFQLV